MIVYNQVIAVPDFGLKVCAFRHTFSMHSCTISSASLTFAPHCIAKAFSRGDVCLNNSTNARLSRFSDIAAIKSSKLLLL
jgi:hypothetical protein